LALEDGRGNRDEFSEGRSSGRILRMAEIDEPTTTTPNPATRGSVDGSRGENRGRRRRWWTVGFVVAIVIVSAAAVVVYEVDRGPVTHVRVILLESPDDVCGIADERFAVAGYNSTGPAATSVTFELQNLNDTTCTVENVNTNTSGFSVGGITVPFSVSERAELAVTVSVTPPAKSYTGNLTIVFR
jgi:hypothetical protein